MTPWTRLLAAILLLLAVGSTSGAPRCMRSATTCERSCCSRGHGQHACTMHARHGRSCADACRCAIARSVHPRLVPVTAAPEPLLGARSSTAAPTMRSRAGLLPVFTAAGISPLELPDPPPRA